jgi:uncharacterized protein
MASLPSGLANEAVELVQIETEDFTLVIKGKPYHERYIGLKQYRQMDRNDVMQFYVTGQGIRSTQVFDVAEQALVEPSSQRPIFFENGIYQLVLSPKSARNFSFYHEHPLMRKAISRVDIGQTYILMGNLQFKNEVGLTSFEIREGEKNLLRVTFEIFPSKLDYKEDYQSLLDEVNDEIYNLAFHLIKKTYLGASSKVVGEPSRAEFYRLLTYHFESFIKAIGRIEQQPHHQLITTHVKARGDQLARVDQKGRQYLRKRPHLFQEVEKGIHLNGKTYTPTNGLKTKKEQTFDTHENRFVKWMMARLTYKIEDLLKKVIGQKRRVDVIADPDLVYRIEKMKKAVQQKLNNPFWQTIGKLDRSVMSLVLQMATGYREAFQIFLIVSRGLVLQGDLYKMSVKDVATLYEYWTYLKLGQLLGRKYKLVSQDIVKVNREGLFVNLDTNRSAQRVYRHPITGEKITLTYQNYVGKLPTLPQIPDTMLSIEKKGKDYCYNYVFDAKYRIDFAVEGSSYHKRYGLPGPMEEDINTMHRYRDSLVIKQNGPYERNAFGAYVLFPWFDQNSYQEHQFYQSINEVNIGGLPFLPNATDLVEQFVERLIEKSPEELQQEGILPKGAVEDWKSAFDEKVLVGMVPREENYHAHVQHCFYHIPVQRLKKGWQEAKYIALYPKKGAAPQNGVTCYGKIVDVKIVKRSEIKELPKDSQEDYVRFEVEAWHNLKEIIRPVDYGIAVYTLTTLNTLKQAKELPELFMKSPEEVALWRMLRRISNRVRITLDHRYLDQASGIQAFRFKDVEIRVDSAAQVIRVISESTMNEIQMKVLREYPSRVFKEIVAYLM